MSERASQAVEYFKSGYNCSQAVVAAYCDLFGLDKETALKISEPFGGGMGRLRLTCGAVSGMLMLAGLQIASGKEGDVENRKNVYAAVQSLAKQFEEKNGSIVCGDLLGLNRPKDGGAEPTPRTKEFYQKRPCAGCVEDCAKLFEAFMAEEQEV